MIDESDILAIFPSHAPPPVILDRSTLERYIICPMQGAAVEQVRVNAVNAPMVSGQEAHEVFADLVGQFARDAQVDVDAALATARMSRPDVQPDVLEAVRPSLWAIRAFLLYIEVAGQRRLRNPADALRYDGGEGARSGQVAWDVLPGTLAHGPVRITSEIDLLLAGGSEAEVQEVDWKSGHEWWTSASVRDSFQFRLHAWLLFRNYPALQHVYTQVWMTRLRSLTAPARFSRADADDFEGILLRAVELRGRALAQPAADLFWPLADRCAACPMVATCPAVKAPLADLAANPVAFAKETEVLQVMLDARMDLLKQWWGAHGDIADDAGWRFGEKPPGRKTAPRLDFISAGKE